MREVNPLALSNESELVILTGTVLAHRETHGQYGSRQGLLIMPIDSSPMYNKAPFISVERGRGGEGRGGDYEMRVGARKHQPHRVYQPHCENTSVRWWLHHSYLHIQYVCLTTYSSLC